MNIVVTKIVYYKCDVCGKYHSNLKTAEACERSHDEDHKYEEKAYNYECKHVDRTY